MKKFLLLSAAVVMLLSSCDNGKEGSNSVTFNIPTYNLITYNDGTTEPQVAASYYRYIFDLATGTATVTTDISPASGQNISFVTSSMNYKSGIYDFGTEYTGDNIYSEVIKMSSMTAATSQVGNITGFESEITSTAFIPPYTDIIGLPSLGLPTEYRYLLVNYNVGTVAKVQTFWSDVTFRGSTTIADGMQYFDNKDACYRLVLNIKDKKATVIIYNAKFFETMPSLTNLVLADLPLKFTNHGYEISATNVTPVSYETGEAVSKPEYKFDRFEFSSSGRMTSGVCSFEVAGSYQGDFSGECILPLKEYSWL